MPTPLRALALSILGAVLLTACASSGAAPNPTPAESGGPIRSPQEALARLVTANPQFAGITPLNSDLIGQCCWYTASPAAGGGFEVVIHVGWGDCPSGCIEKHEWTYVVAPDGAIALRGESGDPVPPDVLPNPGGPSTGIAGTAVAGPTCPVVRENDPACDPRPVAGARITVRTLDGAAVATAQTDAVGQFALDIPPGNYTVEAAAPGFMGAPAPVAVTVIANTRTDVQLDFDTGIR